ncbi:MAG: aminodeoxychorismate/anthranilate synthase component II [Candidatus Melainabacteria bacterium]|nr:aminodeoxychorismate/anthranilate synthase component II [Candidatus Melainabacteria bacterium]
MILLIDNYDSFTHNLYQLTASFYPDVKVVRNDKITLDEIAALKPKAIILSPGPGRPDEAGICLDVIRAFASTIPLLGVCLGHQAIGMAFGGSVVSAPEILHGKRSQIFHRRQGLFKGAPLPCTAGRYHSLVIEKQSMPDCLTIEAEDIDGTVMAVRHKQFPCFGVQFHPESILTSQGDVLIRNFLKEAGIC